MIEQALRIHFRVDAEHLRQLSERLSHLILLTQHVEIVEGRTFSRSIDSASANVIINGKRGAAMGMDEPVGKAISTESRGVLYSSYPPHDAEATYFIYWTACPAARSPPRGRNAPPQVR